MEKVRIASRASPLALRQSELIKDLLLIHHPRLNVEIIGMTTIGDQHLETSLAKVGGKGLFVKELEQALLANKADIAVHSLKDIPVDFPEGLTLKVVTTREDPRDAFVSERYQNFFELPPNAIVGTASLRRQSQLKILRPDLIVQTLRGNVQTRLNKLKNGEFDAIVLAAAGLKRLNLQNEIKHYFEPHEMLPAVGQGVLGIECRVDDTKIHKLISPLNDQATEISILAERAFNFALEGGCQVPVAAFATINDDQIWLRGFVGYPDGHAHLSSEIRGALQDAERLGYELAKDLKLKGADKILKSIYG
ncbi:MAG: hydroxymethylbilane synthase [Gammaproteobacteria bacterium]